MKRSFVPLLVIAMAVGVLSCADATGPIDDHALVLAFSEQGGQHCGVVLGTLTGQTREVERACGFNAAWSPDGSRLAFNRLGGEAAPPRLWMVNADGSTELEIVAGRGLVAPDSCP